MPEVERLQLADRWPVLHNWMHGGTASAPEVIRECRDVLAYLGATAASQARGAEAETIVAELIATGYDEDVFDLARMILAALRDAGLLAGAANGGAA